MSQRGTRPFESPSVIVCASSWWNVRAHENVPIPSTFGASIAMNGPKQTPSAPRPLNPAVRTEKRLVVPEDLEQHPGPLAIDARRHVLVLLRQHRRTTAR